MGRVVVAAQLARVAESKRALLDTPGAITVFTLLTLTVRCPHASIPLSYNADFKFFRNQVTFAQAHLPADKYVCGLATTHESGPSSGQPFNDTELAWRFDFLKERGVTRVAVWDSPLPPLWLPYLAAFGR